VETPSKLPVQDSVPGSSAKAKGKTPVRRNDASPQPKKGPVTDVVSEELRGLLRREAPPTKNPVVEVIAPK
jgi:hypothetical protein